MRQFVFILTLFCFGTTFAESLGDQTYCGLATELTTGRLKQAIVGVETIGEGSLPHETKDIRKQVLSSREMLDLFAYCFVDGEKFLKIRKLLDEGYEIIGHFKDLYDLQNVTDPRDAHYNMKDVRKRLRPVLDWQREFLLKKSTIHGLVENVLSSGRTKLKKKDLSSQFWGASSVEPLAQNIASETFSELLKDLWRVAFAEYKLVRKIKDPSQDQELIETYHNFRKRVRSAIKVIQYFDDFQTQYPPSEIETMTALVEHYGEISDMVAKLELLENSKKDSTKLRKAIRTEWDNIQSWENSVSITKTLKTLRDI